MDHRAFNVGTDVNAFDCTRGCTDTLRERICTESWLWEKNPLPHRGIEPASTACRPDALPSELHPHPFFPVLTTGQGHLRTNHTVQILLDQFQTQVQCWLTVLEHNTVSSKYNQVKKQSMIIISLCLCIHFTQLQLGGCIFKHVLRIRSTDVRQYITSHVYSTCDVIRCLTSVECIYYETYCVSFSSRYATQ